MSKCHIVGGSNIFSLTVADYIAADNILVAFSAGSENVPAAERGVHHGFWLVVFCKQWKIEMESPSSFSA